MVSFFFSEYSYLIVEVASFVLKFGGPNKATCIFLYSKGQNVAEKNISPSYSFSSQKTANSSL